MLSGDATVVLLVPDSRRLPVLVQARPLKLAGQICGPRWRSLRGRLGLFSGFGVDDASEKKIVRFFHPYW